MAKRIVKARSRAIGGGIPGPPRGFPRTPAPPPIGAPPPAGPLPWDTDYESRLAAIARRRDQDLAGVQQQEATVRQEFGFDDVSNPFNRLKMLERAYQQSKEGNRNSMSSAGQLYSGAFQRQQGEIDYGQTRDRDSLRRSYDQVLSDIASRRQRITTGAEDEKADAAYNRTLAALQNRPDPSTLARQITAPAGREGPSYATPGLTRVPERPTMQIRKSPKKPTRRGAR